MTGPEAAQGLARGIHVAATMSIFGTALFQVLVAPPARVSNPAAIQLQRRFAALGWSSLAVAFAAALAWLGFQAAAFAGGDSVGDLLAAVPLILFDTHFGPLMAVRFALLIPACLVIGGIIPRRTASFALASVLGVGAIELQVLLGHGMSMAADTRIMLVTSAVLHILAAGAWLGGLVPLMLLIAGLPPLESAAAVRRFSSVGVVCVTALAATSLCQIWLLIGGLPGLIGTDYGRLAMAKLFVFIGLLLLAALNRFRLRPRLAGAEGEATRRKLVLSILTETALGLGVLVLAGMLLMLAPAIHQQPDWPFPWALDLSNLARPRLVPAHPTSFYRSPTGFTAASITHGGRLFATNCAGCHAAAEREAARPGDRSDGDLFWLLQHGAAQAAMPGFGGKLSPGDLWAVIDFLKARGVTDGPPSAAPDLPVTENGKTVPLSRLRGKIIRLVAMERDETPTQISGAATFRIDPGSDGWTAYAIVAGVDQARLRHFEFLIDAAGKLRATIPPTQSGAPDDAGFAAAAK
jgi:putative copper export protein/mono/diheme cytochrome c family protein